MATTAVSGETADALAHARLSAREMALDPAAWLPADLDAAYALQQAVSAQLGPIAAWKVSALSAAAQRQMGVSRPIAAALPARYVASSPAHFNRSAWRHPLLECEFAFQLLHDLPVRSRPYSRDEVEHAIGALCLAIEVCDSRLPPASPLLAQLADGFNNGALVTTPALADWRSVDYAGQAICLRFTPDGAGEPARELARGNGGPILDGDPVAALVLMANLQPQPYGGLRAGQVVTTGTCTGAVALPGAGRVEADFGALGSVHLRCSA
jgi:2-keto-4-pentenoate hydratase